MTNSNSNKTNIMTKDNIFKLAFVISFILITTGAFFKILHLPEGEMILIAGMVVALIYIAIALYEIYGSKRITMSEKLMWTISFIVFSPITGLLYYFSGRPRILRSYKILNQ